MRAAPATRQWAVLALHVVFLLAGVAGLQIAAERTNRRFDLTLGRELSLSPVTTQVLGELGGPLRVTVFHRRGTRSQYAPLLARLAAASPRVEFELLDLDRSPERARALGVAQYGAAALEYEGRRVVAPALPEEELVGGIVKVLRTRARRVAFTAGHGERPARGEDGYGRLVAALETDGYRVETMALASGDVPEDVDVVVVAGPQHDLLASEVEGIAAYLRRGGAVLFLLEPGRLPGVTALLARFGIRIDDDVVVDPARSVLGTGGMAAIVELFKRGNPITEPGGTLVQTGAVLPSARSLDVGTDVPGVTAEAIARTSDTAWIVRDVERARRGDPPSAANGDHPGGATVMAMAEVERGPGDRAGRLVVVGDADFASDPYLDILGNRDLALNAVAWLGEEPMLVGERRTKPSEIFRPLSPLVLSESQARALLLGVAVVQPGLVLLAGAVVVGMRRRHG